MRTYGEVRHERGKWAIRCDPHVMTRIKRVFEKVDKGEHGCVFLSDTPENCRELLWFLGRYPMKVTPADKLVRGDRLHKIREAQVQKMTAADYKPTDYKMAIPPRAYQSIAADLLRVRGDLLCGDDLGLGKTATFITALTDARLRPALIVTLTALPPQWKREIDRFLPGMDVFIPKTGTAPFGWPSQRSRMPDVVVMNYHKLVGWADVLAPKVHSVCFDEIQELRTGSKAHKYTAARHIAENCQFRMGLTATPIYNYGGEIYNVVDVLAPGSLGTVEEFRREWCTDLGNEKWSLSDPRGFGLYLRDQGLMLRRTRADVGRELPPIQRIPHVVDTDQKAFDDVAADVAELARKILARTGDRMERMQDAGELDYKLRQATGIAKAPYVAEFVKLLVENGESVVLFGWHRAVYDVWMSKLKDYHPMMFTGSESPREKIAARDAFIAGTSKVMIMSLRAGAGLEGLQERARTVVFGELDWSSGVHDQCEGRLHRDRYEGAAQQVMAYYLVADEGSDPVVSDVLGIKRNQLEGVRDPQLEVAEKLTGNVGDHIKKLAQDILRRRQGGR